MVEKQQVLRKRWTHWKSLHPRSQYHDTGSAVLLITIPSNYSNLIFFQHPCDRQTRGTLVALSCENHKDHQKSKCTKWVVFFSQPCFCLTFPLLLKLTKTPSHAKKLENTWERIHIRPLLMMFQWLCARSVGVCISKPWRGYCCHLWNRKKRQLGRGAYWSYCSCVYACINHTDTTTCIVLEVIKQKCMWPIYKYDMYMYLYIQASYLFISPYLCMPYSHNHSQFSTLQLDTTREPWLLWLPTDAPESVRSLGKPKELKFKTGPPCS